MATRRAPYTTFAAFRVNCTRSAIRPRTRRSCRTASRRWQALPGSRATGPGDLDHGVWGVLRPMFPAADIPVLAMSLDRALTAQDHLALAARLAPLRREGVMIVGSGNVVHNLALWRESAGTVPGWARSLQDRITAAMQAGDLDALSRFEADDEASQRAINSAEHYLPLLYIAGARLPEDDVGVFNDSIDGALSMTSYLLGDPAVLAQGPAPAQ
ncbi:dioxygenase [Novosphingobium colocasiae]